MISLKKKELFYANLVSRAMKISESIEQRIRQGCIALIKRLRREVDKQRNIRRERLEFIALEAVRIKEEIKELAAAYEKHGDNLAKF